MRILRFRPRETFNKDLKYLNTLDPLIVDEMRAAVDLLLETGELPHEFKDHSLVAKYTGYKEFHLRDTPKNNVPSDVNDVLVIYRIYEDELILVGVRIGSHKKLFDAEMGFKK